MTEDTPHSRGQSDVKRKCCLTLGSSAGIIVLSLNPLAPDFNRGLTDNKQSITRVNFLVKKSLGSENVGMYVIKLELQTWITIINPNTIPEINSSENKKS